MAIDNKVQDFPETRKLLVEAGYDLNWVVRDGIEEDGLRIYVPRVKNEWFTDLVEAAERSGWGRADDEFFGMFFLNWGNPEAGSKIYDAYQQEVKIYGDN